MKRNEQGFPVEVLMTLACPLCGSEFLVDSTGVTCGSGHAFDRARQGYINLRTGHAAPVNADTSDMVIARETVQESGILSPLRDAIARLVGEASRHRFPDALAGQQGPVVVDLAGGTGYYLAGALEELPTAIGLCLDLSPAALKRAARAHPRAVALGADIRDRLPLTSGAASIVMSVFGPRNADETHRILRSGGLLVVVTPNQDHLAEIVSPLGMVKIDSHKRARLAAQLTRFTKVEEEHLTYRATVDRAQVTSLAMMGPSAHHISHAELRSRILVLPETLPITVSVTATMFTAA